MPRQLNPDRVKVPVRRRTTADGDQTNGNWWALESERKRGAALWETVQILNVAHSARHMNDALLIGLYENRPPYWLGKRVDPLLSMSIESAGRRVPLNLVKSVIDTAMAMLGKNTAELRAFTSGGSWRDQRKAKQITKYNKGAFYLNGFHRQQQRSFIDGCLTGGRGAVKFWPDFQDGIVRCQRTHPRQILWNEMEGDEPRNLFQWRPVARETLLRRFPQKAETIAKAKPSVNPVNPAYRRATELYSHADLVDVAEGWHLGHRNEEDSGRHVLQVDSGCLVDEPWAFDMFPFATFCWDDADEGWGGRPLADTLAGFQTEISRHIRIYRKALERAAAMAGPWLEQTAEPETEGEFNQGEPWTPHKYRGKEPIFAAPPALDSGFLEYILFQYDKAFAEAGFSMLQAQGEKPAGVDAAVALREYNDITATRQVPKGQRYERQTEDGGKIQMFCSKRLFSGAKSKSIKVRAPGTRFLEEVDFKDIADVDESAYILQQSATSSLPTHFVGKLNAVVDMVRGGLFPKKQIEAGLGLRLLQMPDLEKEIDIETSARELTGYQVDEALYEGHYVAPEPYQSPEMLLEVAQNSYLLAKTMTGVPRRNKRLLERLMSEAQALIKKRQLAAPAPAANPAGPGAQALETGAPPPFTPPAGPPQQVITETPATPLPQQPPLPTPAVPSAAPALPV